MTVKKKRTGIRAKVFVEDWDKEWSHVYSHEGNGDYYRPIEKGVYDVTYLLFFYLPSYFFPN
ncbi:MAG: hypothetical protein KGY74_10285 [Candidatus Cloacimonetes bacterium]|nr:hypothetical protein [Candidatus Cloacimonadota bacterium]